MEPYSRIERGPSAILWTPSKSPPAAGPPRNEGGGVFRQNERSLLLGVETKDWFERAKLVVAAARERAVETTQQRVVPSMKCFPTVLQRRRLAERLSAK
jgi:hypothetical protein